jgi:hypothetical protein
MDERNGEMARFQTTAAMYITTTGGVSMRVKAGSYVVDSVGNKVAASDVVWASLSSSTVQPHMVPIDGAATTMKNASPYAGVLPPCCITGRDSIDA